MALERTPCPGAFREPMRLTSSADNSSCVPSTPPSDTDETRRSNNLSTRNAGVPVSNQ